MTLPRLSAIEQRTQKATPGPWEDRVDALTEEVDVYHDGGNVSHIASLGQLSAPRVVADAELISHSRQDMPALTASIRAVLELHKRRDDLTRNIDGKPTPVCDHCGEPDGWATPYPCPTVDAITEHLDI